MGKIRDFQCRICSFKCFGSSSLNQHVKSVHLKIKDFSCELCGYMASRGADINKHLRAKHKIATPDLNHFSDHFVKRTLSDPDLHDSSGSNDPKSSSVSPHSSRSGSFSGSHSGSSLGSNDTMDPQDSLEQEDLDMEQHQDQQESGEKEDIERKSRVLTLKSSMKDLEDPTLKTDEQDPKES